MPFTPVLQKPEPYGADGTDAGSPLSKNTDHLDTTNLQSPPHTHSQPKAKRRKTKRYSRLLNGLGDVVLSPPTTQQGDTNATVKHVTRQFRRGRASVNYDMKLHPMDVVMRPAHSAKRLGLSLPARGDDQETDEESLLNSAAGSSSDSASDSGVEEVVTRTPDPKATRHSTRAVAQKVVNYSRKHHPQDYALPGYQHKARASPATRSSTSSNPSTESRKMLSVQIPSQKSPLASLRTPSRHGDSDGDGDGDGDTVSFDSTEKDDESPVAAGSDAETAAFFAKNEEIKGDRDESLPSTAADRQLFSELMDGYLFPKELSKRHDSPPSPPAVPIEDLSTENLEDHQLTGSDDLDQPDGSDELFDSRRAGASAL